MGGTVIPCISCGAEFEDGRFFEHCTFSFPKRKWVVFNCPKCDVPFHAHLRKGSLALGFLDGGATFIPERTVSIPGLRFNVETGRITVHVGGRSFHVLAR